MRVFVDFRVTRWTIHLVPIIDLYIESNLPLSLDSILSNGGIWNLYNVQMVGMGVYYWGI